MDDFDESILINSSNSIDVEIYWNDIISIIIEQLNCVLLFLLNSCDVI
jgi:hypothetical protein